MRQWILAIIAIILAIIAFFQIKDAAAPQSLFDMPFILPDKIVREHVLPALQKTDERRLERIATEECKAKIGPFMEAFEAKIGNPSDIVYLSFMSNSDIIFAEGHTVSGTGEIYGKGSDEDVIGRVGLVFIMQNPDELRWYLHDIEMK